MADDTRCQNCGNVGRFTVVVINDRVSGQWCRNACSRLCGEILGRKGVRELENTGGMHGHVHIEFRPQLSGASAQCIIR